MTFEWDRDKNDENIEKHMVSFERAEIAWTDPWRVVMEDKAHSTPKERRYILLGRVAGRIMTVRFTRREERIRIIGAGVLARRC